ncbi:uncharacterized protein VP01_49g3 [Puccinia sorghi]|uniref:Chromo domain-containing protein n=1 Tax=Puccinia sorghi TaxID=27349 RepID=A0A0L6ULQ2_9BASI|nr:uncharacterized protein VP01_49g3 [Puccinia sorghi]
MKSPHWKGFGLEENSWELAENLKNCGDLVQEFNSILPKPETKYQEKKMRGKAS